MFLKSSLGFWYINLYFFWSSFPFSSQPLLRVCSVAEALPFAWRVILSDPVTSCTGWALSSFLMRGNHPSERSSNLPEASRPIRCAKYRFKPQSVWLLGPESTYLKFRVDSIYYSLLCMSLLSALICHPVHSPKFSIHRNLTKCRGLLSWHLENLKRLCFQMSPRTCQIWVGVWSVSIYRTP